MWYHDMILLFFTMVNWLAIQGGEANADNAELFSVYQEEADAQYLELLTSYADMNERILNHFDTIATHFEQEVAETIHRDEAQDADQFLTTSL